MSKTVTILMFLDFKTIFQKCLSKMIPFVVLQYIVTKIFIRMQKMLTYFDYLTRKSAFYCNERILSKAFALGEKVSRSDG